MLQFIQSLFKKPKKTCCGGRCHEHRQSSLGLDPADQAKLKEISPLIVIGKIIEISAHPDPKVTKVRVTKVDLGTTQKTILCGAPNISTGQIVPVAQVGTDLGNDFVISERDIRGQTSRGMICARDEIGLSEDETDGIWELPTALESQLGQSLNQL